MSKVANIKFNGGIIHTPSDVSPIDGDLNECINLVPSDGELKPIEMPEKVMADASNKLQLEGTLAAVHEGTWGKNYVSVIQNSGNNCSIRFSDSSGTTLLTKEFDNPCQTVQCIGVIVSVSLPDKLVYFAFKDGEYRYLGTLAPFANIFFYLDNGCVENVDTPLPSTTVAGDTINGIPIKIKVNETTGGIIGNDDNERKANMEAFGQSVYSKIVKLERLVKEKGEFLNPFFLRYAIKMYDGTYINVSQPLLMLPSSYKTPFLCLLHYIDFHTLNGSYFNIAREQVFAIASCIRYNHDRFESSEWDDLISSIDIFITNPIYQYNEKLITEHQYDHTTTTANDIGYMYGLEKTELNRRVTVGSYKYNWCHPDGSSTYMHQFFDLPSFDKERIDNYVENHDMIFYHVKSLKYKDLIGKFELDVKLELDENVLPNLATRKTIIDSNRSIINEISAKCSVLYNSRLAIANITEKISYYPNFIIVSHADKEVILGMKFLIEHNSNIKCVEVQKDVYYPKWATTGYIYFPRAKCMSMLYRTSSGYYKMDLTPSEHLDGSYMYSGLKSFFEHDAEEIEQEEYDRYTNDNEFEYPNRIMVSNVSNPFIFDTLNMIEVGTRQILELSTYALPMSQGQFGQYPIVAFSEDGIRSLGINGDGTIGSVAPVSSADTLTGFAKPGRPNVISDGQSLYFITKRGLMEMRGLQVRCVSEVLNGRTWKYSDYRDCVNPNQGKVQYQNIVMLFGDGIKNSQTFNQAISNPNNPAFLAFDYKHNRILVTNPSLRAHWLYSITDHKWCKMIFNDNYKVDDNSAIQNISQMMSSGLINVKNPNDAVDGRDIVSAVFDWNASYLQTSDGELWDLMGAPDENDDAYYKYGFIASRPIRLGSDEHKSIIRLLHRERINSHYGFRGMRLYGSVDGIRFYEITSLRGASYKYFVVLLYTCMKANERYSYMSVEFEERFQNKLR